MKHTLSACGLLAVLLTGCVSTTVNQDGTTQFTEVDYASVQLMSSATVAAWAASQKEGIQKKDAETVLRVLDLIEEFRRDGAVLNIEEWSVAIRNDVPLRYQALALVLVQLVELQLSRYGVAATVPQLGSVPSKIMEAVRNGAVLALMPYVDQKTS